MKTALLFGSFNPIHIGHLIVAEHFVAHGIADEVWLVVSPQNPFKQHLDLLPADERVAMAQLAVAGNPRLQVCTEELALPVPSYTCHTMEHLVALFPDRTFSIIIGDDLIEGFSRWKNADWLRANFPIYVFPRLAEAEGRDLRLFGDERMVHVNAPRIGISSTMIRQHIAEGQSIRYLVPDSVREHILRGGYYHT